MDQGCLARVAAEAGPLKPSIQFDRYLLDRKRGSNAPGP